ncbi:MAG: WecB/TagA/CpsF family glycosyltransferase [Aestuariivirga sp.]
MSRIYDLIKVALAPAGSRLIVVILSNLRIPMSHHGKHQVDICVKYSSRGAHHLDLEGYPNMRLSLLGTPVDALSMDETLSRIEDAICSRRRLHHVAMNVAKLVKMRQDPDLRIDVEKADLIGIDGMGIVAAARVLRLPVTQRVAGIDLMYAVLELCSREGYRPYILGAKRDVLDAAIENAQRMWPGLRLAGSCDGYFSAKDEDAVVDGIRQSKADCLFIAMPTPRKERLIARYRDDFGVPFVMGVGGSIDVLAGHVKRAPPIWQRFGLEWLYRVYQEPSRMWWRYFSTNAVFGLLLARALVGQRLGLRQ